VVSELGCRAVKYPSGFADSKKNAGLPRLAFEVLQPFFRGGEAVPAFLGISRIQHRRYLVDCTKRVVDFILALTLGILLLPLLLVIGVLIKLTSDGPVIYWSDRVGRGNKIFRMPKFRTMSIDAPQLPTHLLSDPSTYLTSIGRLLRRTSLDELPQLFSILWGSMSFVGPRPALFNQDDLIALRAEKGVQELLPGLTGWAQVNGRDELPIPVKVQFDYEYLQRRSLKFDLIILCMTFVKVARGEGIRH
jgi:O-antigen biosynthesis protein WbqP